MPKPSAAPFDRSDWDSWLRRWERSLQPKSERTRALYLGAGRQLVDYLEAQHGPEQPTELTRAVLEDFFADYATTHKPSTCSLVFRSLQQFMKYLQTEEEIDRSPMEHLGRPIVPEVPVPVVSDEDLTKLLKACAGKDFMAVRDTALIRMLIATGGRRGEVAALKVEDVDLTTDTVKVIGKGSRPRTLVISPKAAQALERWMTMRKRDKYAKRTDAVWLNENGRGPMQANGIAQMIERRCQQAGIAKIHPHQFRHTAAHVWLAADGSESDLMRLMGWRSPQMLRRYGASLADERAREAAKRLNLGDRV